MATPVIIADAGPLIALARLQALDVLPRLFGQVLITPTVHEEMLPPGDFPGTAALQAALEAGWLCCQDVSPTAEGPLHDRQRGLCFAEMDRLMRYARRDKEKIPGLVHYCFRQLVTIAGLDPALEKINRGFIAEVNMRLGVGARRYNDPVHREAGGAGGHFRNTHIIGQALKGRRGHRRPDRDNVIFHGIPGLEVEGANDNVPRRRPRLPCHLGEVRGILSLDVRDR